MIPPGYKQTEVGVIPVEWEVQSLKDLNLDISDGNYSSKYPSASDFRPYGVPFIRANNIRNMGILDDDMRFISQNQQFHTPRDGWWSDFRLLAASSLSSNIPKIRLAMRVFDLCF